WGKAHRKPIQKVREGGRAAGVGDEVHSDLWGRAPVETINHKEYFISFTDDHSRYTVAFDSYLNFEARMKTQHGVTVKVFHTDRGGEYLSQEFSDHLKKAGTVRRLTVHDTPEYNGVAERLNRTLMEKVRAMGHDSGLPKFLWGEALMHAVYIKNRTWTRASDSKTPYSGSKLDGRAKEGHWVGFDEESRGHRVYWAEKRSVTVERSVRFVPEEVEVPVDDVPLEGERKDVDEQSVSSDDHQPTAEDAPEPEAPPVDIEPSQGRGKRVRKPSAYVKSIRDGVGRASNLPASQAFPKGLQVPTLPTDSPEDYPAEAEAGALADEQAIVDGMDFAMAVAMDTAEGLNPTYDEARKRSDWPKWEEAIKKVLTLEKNGTWRIVKRPENANVVDSKWVLRIKKNAAGEIDKYKARLVARGFTQVYGIDYDATYAPVARLSTFRYVIALANRNGWPIESIDFDSAFLNAPLGDDEVIYLEQPKGYAKADPKVYVFRLEKSLYGLKQGARNWYAALRKALEELGFKRMEADHGVFVKNEGECLLILVVHVDDCLLTGNSMEKISKFKRDINQKYKITDLGPCTWLLGIKLTRNLAQRTISLSQHAYIESIITRFNFNDLKPSAIPIDPNQQLSRSQCPTSLADKARMKNVPYREAVGSLMYASMGTRPDITFATSTVAQFMDNPGWVHWEAVKKIFRYLKGTKELELVYGGETRDLVGFVDADGASQEHRHAISGYVFIVDGGAVSWASKKQELVTLSTTEAEYVAATHAAKEAVWLRRLISEILSPISEPTTLYGNNQSAIALAHGGQYHARTKHIDIRYHFIRYIIEAGSIRLIYCPTNEQTADTLTKALPSTKAKHFASAMGLRAV
ncbi:hypothetical protein CVT26_014516, partial [Gymnopilus dilepis]